MNKDERLQKFLKEHPEFSKMREKELRNYRKVEEKRLKRYEGYMKHAYELMNLREKSKISFKEIGKKYNISPQAVQYIINKYYS